MDEILSFEKVGFSYQGQKVIDDINLQISAGDFVALLGHNGAGKSTLLRLSLGTLTPQHGQIRLFGQAPSDFSNWEKIGYMQQGKEDLDFEFPASVLEIVLMGRLKIKRGLFKNYSLQDFEHAKKALELVGAWHLSEKKVGSLSGGQRQRVFLAQALSANSRLLILDEPTSAMDYSSQHAFYDTLVELNEKHGITIILITHDVGQVLQHAKRVLVLNKKIVFDGKASELSKAQILEIMERI